MPAWRWLRARAQSQLELLTIDKEMISGLIDNFERVMAGGPNPKKKDLLHRLVKTVIVHARTLEVWYALPNSAGIEHSNNWLPG